MIRIKMKKTIIITNECDAHWEMLLEITNEQEKERLKLFPVDQLGFTDDIGIEFDPIGHKARFIFPDKTILTEQDISSIWYRRLPISKKLARNQQDAKYCKEEYIRFFENLEFALPDVKWVSKPSAIKKTKNKAYQLSLAKRLRFNLPDTVFSNYPESLSDMFDKYSDGIIYKAVDNANIREKKEYLTVWTTKIKKSDLKNKQGLSLCPGILQQFINKKSDIRVTIFGNKVFAVEIQSQQQPVSKIDFRLGGDSNPHVIHNLPDGIESKCRKLVAESGLLFGAIDMALMEDGSYIFFEINANGQWGWLEEQTGLPMRKALLDLLLN